MKNYNVNKGIRRSPSIPEDGECDEMVNLIPRGGEVLNQPSLSQISGVTIDSLYRLKYIHTSADNRTHYINVGVWANKTYAKSQEGTLKTFYRCYSGVYSWQYAEGKTYRFVLNGMQMTLWDDLYTLSATPSQGSATITIDNTIPRLGERIVRQYNEGTPDSITLDNGAVCTFESTGAVGSLKVYADKASPGVGENIYDDNGAVIGCVSRVSGNSFNIYLQRDGRRVELSGFVTDTGYIPVVTTIYTFVPLPKRGTPIYTLDIHQALEVNHNYSVLEDSEGGQSFRVAYGGSSNEAIFSGLAHPQFEIIDYLYRYEDAAVGVSMYRYFAAPADRMAYESVATEMVVQTYNGNTYTSLIVGNNGYVSTNGNQKQSIINAQQELTINGNSFKATNVTAVNNTLICTSSGGLHYFLWDGTQYKYLGNTIPSPSLQFRCDCEEQLISKALYVENSAIYDDIYQEEATEGKPITIGGRQYNTSYLKIMESQQLAANHLMEGLMNTTQRDIDIKNGFSKPFLLRYALRLYDGTYHMCSQPILMLPVYGDNILFWFDAYDNHNRMHCCMPYAKLQIKNTMSSTAYELWSDIVKGIAIFVTDGASPYYTDMDVPKTLHSMYESGQRQFAANQIVNFVGSNDGILHISHDYRKFGFEQHYSGDNRDNLASAPITNVYKFKGDEGVIKELKNRGVFYKIAEVNTKKTSGVWEDIDNYLLEDSIVNLRTMPTLEDDYYSRCPITASHIDVYNRRLHLNGVTRGFFNGFDEFLTYTGYVSGGRIVNFDGGEYRAIVHIQTPQGKRVLINDYQSNSFQGFFYYYPDPRANEVIMCKKDGTDYKEVMRYNLSAHAMMNGAYCFESLPVGGETYTLGSINTETTIDTPETLLNNIVVSMVNNPFVFDADGHYTIGNGNVISIATAAKELSQGQFGVYPLYVFCSDGVYAMETKSEGTYGNALPLIEDVVSNVDSICQVDRGVFYATAQGLKYIEGNEIRLMSGAIDGRVAAKQSVLYTTQSKYASINDIMPLAAIDNTGEMFHEYIQTARLMYDAANGLVHLYRPSNSNVANHYVMTMDGEFALCYNTSQMQPMAIVKGCPYSTLQFGTNLYKYEKTTDKTTFKYGYLLTRPCAFETMVERKQIVDMRLVYTKTTANNTTSSVRVIILASDDMVNWYEVTSLQQQSHKWYRFALYTNLTDLDRVSGMIIDARTRRSDRMI